MSILRGLVFPAAVVMLALLGGCPSGPANGSGGAKAAAPDRGPPSETYTVRGMVAELPEAGKPQREFKVRHEAIDDFVGAKGEVVGMNAMTMSFPPGPGVTIDGLAVDDIVELTFAVWRKDGAFDWHTTRIVKLPPETALVFGKAKGRK